MLLLHFVVFFLNTVNAYTLPAHIRLPDLEQKKVTVEAAAWTSAMSCCYFICCAIDPCVFVCLYIYTVHAHKIVLGQGFAPSYLACIFFPHTNIFFFLLSFFPPPYLFFTVSPFLTTFKGSLLLWLNGVLNDSNDHVTWMHFKDVTAGTVPHYKCLRAGKFC